MRFQRLVIGWMLVAWSTGCTGWRSLASTQPVPRQEGQHLRVTLRGGQQLELSKANAVGDSLIGVAVGDTLTAHGLKTRPAARTAVALADVVKLENRRFSVGNTLGLTLFFAIPVFAVGYTAAGFATVAGR